METCTDSDQAGNPLHGASPYMDPDYEFNAPRFYDFQRLKENLASPVSEGDTYFNTSKVKGEGNAESIAEARQRYRVMNCIVLCRQKEKGMQTLHASQRNLGDPVQSCAHR